MNIENGKSDRALHRVDLRSRESMEVRGVLDVNSFDEESVVLSTVCGTMEIEGNSLHIHVLSMEEGVITLDGKIDSIAYYEEQESEKTQKHGFFGNF